MLFRLFCVFLLWSPVRVSLEVLRSLPWTVLRMPTTALSISTNQFWRADLLLWKGHGGNGHNSWTLSGLKSSKDIGHRGDCGRYSSSHDDYGYRRSPRHSPQQRGHDYTPKHSSHGGRSRREPSRSLPRSPYDSPERKYSHGSR